MDFKKFKMFRSSFLTLLVLLESVHSLRLEDADEGSCRGIPTQPVPINDPRFLNRLTYVAGASRLHYYIIASQHPRFSQMRDSELVNKMCLTHTLQYSQPVSRGSVFAFGGQNLGNFTARRIGGQPGHLHISQDPNPADSLKDLATATQITTLTDYKTYAFAVICWNINTQHKAWLLYSLTAQLSSSTKRVIEDHAASLGFDRKDFVFLNYRNCNN